MRCPKCGLLNMDGAQYCVECAAALPQSKPAAPPSPPQQMPQQPMQGQPPMQPNYPQQPYPPGYQHPQNITQRMEGVQPPLAKKKDNKILGIIIGLMVVVIALLGFIVFKLMNPTKQTAVIDTSNPTAVTAQPSTANPTTQVGAPNTANPTDVSGQANEHPEIYAWLAHLEKIEMKRRELAGRQASVAMNILAHSQADNISQYLNFEDPDAEKPGQSRRDEFIKQMNDMGQEWQVLRNEFNSYQQVPETCRNLAMQYDMVIRDYPAIFNKLIKALVDLDTAAAKGTSKDRQTLTATIGQCNKLLSPLIDMSRYHRFEIEQEGSLGDIDKLLLPQ